MRIFTGIAYNNHYETICDAVAAIVKNAQQLALMGTPWSLVELSADQEDFDWLGNWAQSLSPGVASFCLTNGQWRRFETTIGKCSYATGIGILLLMSAVEVARRNANERSLWSSIISRSHFSQDTQKILFAQNYPIRAYKDTIELAVRWLKLRHVFGVEGLQNWYDSIYLQLGFTKLGFTSRLPEWLAGQSSTFAVQQLLNSPMRSTTFTDLWNALSAFRRKNISEESLRSKLQHNPWILPEWIPALIQQAASKPYLGSASPLKHAMPLLTDEALAQVFLEQPQLFWDLSEEPSFRCQVINLSLLELTEPTYSIMIAGRTYGQLRQHSDGTYKNYPSDEIKLPATSSLLVASLLTPDGNIAQSQTLQLWDQGEDISAFAFRTGEVLDPWRSKMSTQKSYYLILASDLVIQPYPTYWYHLNPHTTLYLLEKDWSPDTQVLLNGSVLWQPKISSSAPVPEELGKEAIQVHLYNAYALLSFYQPARFEISHPQHYKVTFVRSAGQSVLFEQHTAHSTVTAPIKLLPQMFSLQKSTSLELTLGLQHVDTLATSRVRTIVEVPIIGAALLSEKGWVPVNPERSLDIEQTKRQVIRFYFTSSESWPLLEGDTWIDNIWRTPRPLHACAGLGAPLKLQKSAYNALAFERPHQVTREVINKGCVKAVSIGEEQQKRIIRIRLTRSIEPDHHYSIVWWDQDGSYTLLEPSNWEVEDGIICWFASVLERCTQPLAVAVAYDGNWLGTWYRKSWSKILSLPTGSATTLSALMRWFHLPLMSQNFFSAVELFADTHVVETLPIWLDERCSLPHLQFASSDEGWLSAVRKVYFNWQPGSNLNELVQQLVDSSLADDPLKMFEQMIWKVSRVNPILMAKILQGWIERVCVPQWGKRLSMVLIQQLSYNMAEAQDKVSFEKKRADLLQELADMMQVDPNFIKISLLTHGVSYMKGYNVFSMHRENIAVAMQIEPFRRLLSIHLLEQIHNQLREI